MTSETTVPMPPGGANDLPGQTAPAWQPYTPPATPSIVEPIPDSIAVRGLALMAAGGLLAQLLFFGQSPGINVLVWIVFVLCGAAIVRRRGARTDRFDLWLPLMAVVFAALCAWRTDPMLIAFNLVATGSLTLASVVAMGGKPLTRTTKRTVARYGARAMALFLAGAPYLAGGLRAIRPARDEAPSTARRVAHGVLLAAPIVLVFAALFGAADAVFGTLVDKVVSVNLDEAELTGRIALFVLAGWLLGGTLVCTWLRRQEVSTATEAVKPRIGSVEALVLLLCIDAVIGAFVIVQAAYLFGGLDTLGLSGMTYSEYARRGFGELVVAALFAGLVLVIVFANTAHPGRAQRVLAALLCLGTGVIVLSAFQRIGLYQDAYGWTELRFYTVVGIVWLGACALAALAAVASDRVGRLPAFALAAGLVVAVVCNVIGPQAFVTDQNVRRAADPALVPAGGKSGLDVDYLYTLDADAARILAQSSAALPDDIRGRVDGALKYARHELALEAERGWQSWNYARSAALEALIAAGY